jgi:hypothetical protein
MLKFLVMWAVIAFVAFVTYGPALARYVGF